MAQTTMRFGLLRALVALALVAGCGEEESVAVPIAPGADTEDSGGVFFTEDTGTTDTAADDIGAQDTTDPETDTGATEADAAAGDVGTDDAGTEPSGSFGEECASAADCESGACVPHLGGQACSDTCTDSCPTGWVCEEGTCQSAFPLLCKPCTTIADCVGNPGGPECIHVPGQGGFCGAGCATDSGCPSGWSCQTIETVAGLASSQCVPDSGSCDCSALAVEEGWSAWCPASGGGCPGVRLCTAVGLGPCLGGSPSAEVCNGKDDDCDGTVDEGSCDDANGCTTDLCDALVGCQHTPLNGVACGGLCVDNGVCVEGECTGPPAIDCNDGDPCTKDLCHPVNGCITEPQPGDCDDGDACTENDTCVDGVCVGESGPGCTPGTLVEQACGQCGTQECVCVDGCNLDQCGECAGQGACAPGDEQVDTQNCEGCAVQTRTRTCGDTCEWGAWSEWGECTGGSGGGECEPGQSETQTEACGACGSRSRTRMCTDQCGWSGWTDWSACTGGGVCSPGDVDTQEGTCGNCGNRTRNRTCGDTCEWGGWGDWSACSSQGVCAPGATDSQNQGCGNCGSQTRTRTCSNSCTWSGWTAWGACGGQGVCAPGATAASDCDACAEKTCNNSCQWGSCQLKAGAQCLWEGGSNWKCCGAGSWHFCLGPSYGCVWSDQCAACSGCGC